MNCDTKTGFSSLKKRLADHGVNWTHLIPLVASFGAALLIIFNLDLLLEKHENTAVYQKVKKNQLVSTLSPGALRQKNLSKLPPSGARPEIHQIAEAIRTYKVSDKQRYKLAQIIVYHSQNMNIDPFIAAAVIAVETSFRWNAATVKTGLGLMQLSANTAMHVMKNVSPSHTQRDPEDAQIELGIRYLKDMTLEFNGDMRLALAAYNWGPGRVNKSGRKFAAVPGSVKKYVDRVLTNAAKWRKGLAAELIRQEKEQRVGDFDLPATKDSK